MTERLLPDRAAKELRILRKVLQVPVDELADLYGVSQTTAANIIRGVSYPDAGGPIEDHGTRMYRPREKKERTPKEHTPGQVDGGRKHGTPWGVQWGCKCELCLAANAARSRAYRKRKKEEKLAADHAAAPARQGGVHGDAGGPDLVSAG